MGTRSANATSGPEGDESAVPRSLTAESLWDALTTDPQTGVAIVTIDGELRYTNDQAVRFFIGPGAAAAPYIGTQLRSVFPPALVNDRLELMRRMIETGRPVALRGIWRGRQHLTLIRYIEGESREDGEDGATDAPAQFLFIIRPVSDGAPESLVDDTRYEFVESKVIDLGPLDVLTVRELEVPALLGQGLSIKEIAATLFRTVKTIEKHRAAIGQKLAAHDRVALAEIARRAGLTIQDAARQRV